MQYHVIFPWLARLRFLIALSACFSACTPIAHQPVPALNPSASTDSSTSSSALHSAISKVDRDNINSTNTTDNEHELLDDVNDDVIDDGFEDEIGDDTDENETPEATRTKRLAHPFAELTDEQLTKRYIEQPESVGCLSIGSTNAGRLINAVQMPQGPYWIINDPSRAWGTSETVEGLIRCIRRVNEVFPNTEKMRIGHISSRSGGPLSPHVSHQAGRDVDVSYYYTKPSRWFARAHERNLDTARTWEFVKALITLTDVEMILIDISLQRVLRRYADQIGEDQGWLDDIFRGKGNSRGPLIRHAKGHATHIHVRFYSPIARETARRLAPALGMNKQEEAFPYYISYKAKKGDTLGSLANLYGTTIKAIKQANGLRSTAIQARRIYRIPASRKPASRKPTVAAVTARPIVAPLRRLPKPSAAQQ